MTQHEKIIERMVVLRAIKEWFVPMDFMPVNMGPDFVGYESSARLSEIAKWYPEMIDSRRVGKFKERRIAYERLLLFWYKIPTNIQMIFEKYEISPAKIEI